MTALTFDQKFATLVGLSITFIVLASGWIVSILLNIERTKAAVISSVLDGGDQNDGDGDMDGNSLQFAEEIEMTSSTDTTVTGGGVLEVERPTSPYSMRGTTTTLTTSAGSPKSPSSPSGYIASSPSRSSPSRNMASHRGSITGSSSNNTYNGKNPMDGGGGDKPRRRTRRLPWSFVAIQCVSVVALVLLTYLLLVVSNAPMVLSLVGSLCVFAVFLRYQIGDELRRQRLDRLLLLLGLFLAVASFLSLAVFGSKTLRQGEIYEGPARIVGYDASQYNNSKHDPTTRTDVAVSWGRDWGCPMSGGKVCQSRIEGAMCQAHPDASKTKSKSTYGGMEEDLEKAEQTNQELVQENADLEKEAAELEKEVDELKEENKIEEDEQVEIVDEADSMIYEVEDTEDGEVMEVEEEEYDMAKGYTQEEDDLKKQQLQDQIDSTTDPDKKAELQKELDALSADEAEVTQEYNDVEQEYEDAANEAFDYADEDWDDAEDAEEQYEELDEKKSKTQEEIKETEAVTNQTKAEVEKDAEEVEQQPTAGPTESKEQAEDDEEGTVAQKEGEAIAKGEEEIVEEAEEEAVTEAEGGSVGGSNPNITAVSEYQVVLDDDWYWDESPTTFNDDSFEDGYWDYDWDSVWGDYSCEDLFDSDMGFRTFDMNTPAGGDDDWPYMNIYGSCKTCEAYILDYFAEEAFEEVDGLRQQAILYMVGAMGCFVASFLAYIKYRVMPTAENQVELLGYDGGVLA